MYACVYSPNLSTAQYASLVQCLGKFSPLIEPGPERVVVDIRGLGSLMGRPKDVASRMSAALDLAEIPASIAIASNPHTAIAAARGIPGITVVSPGDEARALSRLPLSLLEPEAELFDTLAAWGIHTFGDLSRLPEAGLAERLGPEGVRLHMLARGQSPRPIVPGIEKPSFEASLELEHALDSLEPLAFILGRLLNEICARLSGYGLSASEICVRLGLENRTQHTRTIRLPYATADSASLLKLLQYDIAAHPPQSPILKVTLLAEPAPQRKLQGGLFLPGAPESEKLELTLARLTAVVGEGNVGSPEMLNTHRPDSFRINRFVARTDRLPTAAPPAADTPLVIHMYRPPIPAEVAAPHGFPERISARGITGNVVGYAGPWRTSGDWWCQDPWARDEWDIALDNGTAYRISREMPVRAPVPVPEIVPSLPNEGLAPPPEVPTPIIFERTHPRNTMPNMSAALAPVPGPVSAAQPRPRAPSSPAKSGQTATRWFINGNYD